MKMKTSNKGIELIKKHEGLRLKAYLCPAGKWTIGYGHTKDVKPGQVITEEEAERLLRDDLAIAENEINRHNLDINQNQFDALASFVYNVGVGNFRTSTLLKKIKANPNDESIADEFRRWVYSNGKKLPGLVKRREEEAELYFKEIEEIEEVEEIKESEEVEEVEEINETEEKRTINYKVSIALKIILIILLLLIILGCKTKEVLVPSEKTVIEYRDRTFVDSVYNRDTLYLFAKNDTVYIQSIKWRERFKVDTVMYEKIDSIPYFVEVIKEVNVLTKWQKIRLQLLNVIVLAAVITIIVYIVLKRRH